MRGSCPSCVLKCDSGSSACWPPLVYRAIILFEQYGVSLPASTSVPLWPADQPVTVSAISELTGSDNRISEKQ